MTERRFASRSYRVAKIESVRIGASAFYFSSNMGLLERGRTDLPAESLQVSTLLADIEARPICHNSYCAA
jgi:hypothetical protein